MKARSILFTAILIATAFAAQPASAQSAGLTGKWSGDLKTPDGNDLQVTYLFKVDGDKLTGTAESPAGTVTIDDGKVAGDKFLFKVTVDGNDYPQTGTFKDDACEMDIDFGGQKVHFTLKRDKG